MRFKSKYVIQKVDFLDDVGWFSEKWAHSSYLNEYPVSNLETGPRGVQNLLLNWRSQGKMFYKDLYWHLQISSSRMRKKIRRSSSNMMQVFSKVGGLLQFFTIGISLCYYFYNYYKMKRHAVLYSIIGKQGLFPKEYQIKDSYARLYFCRFIFKSCSRFVPKFFSCCHTKYDELFEEQKLVMSDCFTVIDEKMDIKNFLRDSMDFMAIKHLLMKSRHKLLMPSLVLNITRNKTKVSSGYKTSFARNLHERVDRPVFTVEEAVRQLHDTTEARPQTEKDMDEFFKESLPQNVMDMGEDAEERGMDKFQIIVHREELVKRREKIQTVQNFDRKKTRKYKKIVPELYVRIFF
jgi:hypothetical protein